MTGTKKWFRRCATLMFLAAIAVFGGQARLVKAQDISKSVQYGGMETTSAVANSTNSSEIDTYASAVITDYTLWYEGYWAAVEADLYDNGAWIDYNVGDNGFASAETRLSDPINLGHQYDAVATSALCWWIDEGDGFGYEDCSAVYSLDLYGILGKPQINSISPSGGTIGKSGSITVQGQNLVDPFSGNASAAITGSGVTLTVQSNPTDSQVGLNFSIASNATAGNQTQTLSNRFGTSNGEAFTVGYPPAVVNNVSPSVWTAGQQTSVTITGTGFGTAPTLSATGTGVNLTLNSASPDGTTIHATATVALTAPSENVTVTVQPGYAGSGFYCNCPPDQANGTDTATVQPVTPTPQIMFNGGNISGTTQTVMAGQQIALTVPTPSGYSIQSQSWNIPNQSAITGGFVNGAGTPGTQPSAAAGGSQAPIPSMNQNGLTLYWIKPGDNGETVTYTYTLNNGQQASATATFNIGGPTGTLIPAEYLQTTDSATVVTNPTNASAAMQMQNSPRLATAGVVFIESASLPSTGKVIWVQVLKSVTYAQLVHWGMAYTPPASVSNQLDGVYPYPGGNPIYTTNDSPNRYLYSVLGDATVSFDATMYALWDPALPAGCTPANTDNKTYQSTASTCTSIPIPLGSARWRWSACAINQGIPPNSGIQTSPSWVRQCGPGYQYSGQSNGYPEWHSCSTSQYGSCQ